MNEDHARQVAEIEQTMGDLLSKGKPTFIIQGPAIVMTRLPDPRDYPPGTIVTVLSKNGSRKWLQEDESWVATPTSWGRRA